MKMLPKLIIGFSNFIITVVNVYKFGVKKCLISRAICCNNC